MRITFFSKSTFGFVFNKKLRCLCLKKFIKLNEKDTEIQYQDLLTIKKIAF